MLNKIKSFFPVIILLLLGAIPLLWFKPGYIASGHDMGYSLDPVARVTERLYVWPDSFDIGTDISLFLGSIPIYMPEVILRTLHFPLQMEQKIVFMFWFVMPGISMYLLLSSLSELLGIKKEYKTFYSLLGSVFYSLNHYLLHGWFVASKAEFSFVIVTPLILLFALKVLFYKNRPVLWGLIGGLIITFFNGGGGPGSALIGGFLITFIWFLFFFNVLKVFKILSFSLRPLLKFFIVFIMSSLLLNAYWIVPFIYYTKNNFLSLFNNSVGGESGLLNWADAVSMHATFSNIMRLQGFSSWYNNETHPFSNTYLENPFFVILSFIFPLLLILSLYISRKDKIMTKAVIGFFLGLGILTMFFMSGTRTPLGFLYKALLQYIPGFSIFRSPFYKFGYVLWISYAVLFSYSVTILFNRLMQNLTSKKEKAIKILGLSIGIVLLLIYSFPFFNGSFFNWNPPLTTMVKLPSYVFDFQKWIKENDHIGRVLLYPPIRNDYSSDIYSWNYWSLTPFPNLLSEKHIISNKRLFNTNQSLVIDHLYNAIEEKDKEKIDRISDSLNVEYLLLRKDAKSTLSWLVVPDPNGYEAIIKDSPWFVHYKNFGEWDLYKLNKKVSNRKIVEAKNLTETINSQGIYGAIINNFPEEVIVIPEISGSLDDLMNMGSLIVSGCINCDLGKQINSASNIFSRISPTSPLYNFISLKEEMRLRKAKTNKQKSLLLAELSVKRLIEIENMIEKNDSEKVQNMITKFFEKTETMLKEIYQIRKNELPDNDTTYKEYMRVYLSEILERTKSILQKDNLSFDFETRSQGIKSLAQKLEEQDSGKKWETTDTGQLKYIFSANFPGNYNISLVPEKDTNYNEIFQSDLLNNVKLIFNENNLSISPKEFNKIYLFDKISLERNKEYKVTLKIPKYKNLLSVSSFKILPYGDPYYIPVTKIKEDKRYLLSFSFAPESTRQVNVEIIGVLESGKKIIISSAELKDNSSNEKRIIFDTKFSLKKIDIKFKHESSKIKKDLIEIENIYLHQLLSPVIVLHREDKVPAANFKVNELKANKVNSTFYIVNTNNIPNSFYLYFKEGFNRQWKAYFINKDISLRSCNSTLCHIALQLKAVILGEKLPESYHVEANGFANAWYISEEDLSNNSIALIFFPQIVFYISAAVSIIFFMISFLLIIIKLRSK